MARLASQAKSGYYPTPPEWWPTSNGVGAGRGRSLSVPGSCCGCGPPWRNWRQGCRWKPSGWSWLRNDTRRPKTRLRNIILADAITETNLTRNAFSLLWLNPPYDFEADGGPRLEKTFLERYLSYLVPGGVPVYLIPARALQYVVWHLAELGDLRFYAFPQPLYDQFKQVVIIGVKKPELHDVGRLNELAWKPPGALWQMLPKTDEIMPGSIPVKRSPAFRRIIFSSERLLLDEMVRLVGQSALHQEFEGRISPPALHQIRSLAPLRQGHLGMLLAAGFLDGEVAANNRRLAIKGTVRKVVDVHREVNDSDEVVTKTDRYEIRIRAIDLDRIELFDIREEARNGNRQDCWF